MLEMKMRDGVVFDPLDATWTITPNGSSKIYSWTDVVLIGMLDPTYDVTHGHFGPARMPIRGLRFTDPSELAVEIPIPLRAAREIGAILGESKIKVVQSIPSSVLLGRGMAE